MSVTEILLNLGSNDNHTRNQAEQVLKNEQENNFANFCLLLLNELQDETKDNQSRQQAGLVLKNSVALDVKSVEMREVLTSRWTSLGGDVRGQVKQATLNTLGSPTKSVRMIASLIIANLARIELPHNEWPDLIQTLVSGCETGQSIFMEAALTTLGYICEEAFNHDALAEVMENQSELVIKAICAGMSSQDNDVIFAATRALANSLEFVGDHMANQEIQRFIVTTVCDTIGNGVAEIRENAMRCLVKIADLYYSLLPGFIERLFAVTSGAINNNAETEAVKLQALLFWIALGENEKELIENDEQCNNYTASGLQMLVDMCFHCMLQQSPYQTEEDWNISTAGSKLLLTIAETVRDPIITIVMQFVERNINAEAWQQREAALMAFGCILGAPSDENFANTVAQGVSVYLDGLSDSNELVADTAGWVTATVCEMYPRIFNAVEVNCASLINKIGPMINGNSAGMSIRACNIVHNLALSYEDEDEDGGMATNCFSPYYKAICDALIGRIDRPADPSGSGKEQKVAIEALNALIDAAANDISNVVSDLVPTIIERVNYFVGQFNQSRDDNILTIEGLLCGTLSALCKKMTRHIGNHSEAIMATLNLVFSQQASPLEEGIMLLGSLANAIGTDFGKYAPMVIGLVLKSASNYEEEDLCDAAVGVIGDLASSLGREGFEPILDQVVTTVFGALVDPEVDRDQKITFLGCSGDMALHLGPSFSRYLPSLMNIAQTSFSESLKLDRENDYDLDYMMDLWDHLCQLCGLILQGQRDVDGAVVQYAPNMLTLADQVCRGSAGTSPETFAAALGLIGDVANVCLDKPDAAKVLGPHLVNDSISLCVSKGAESKKEDVRRQATWANKQIKALVGRQGN